MISHSDYYPELYACGLYHHPDLKKSLKKVKSNEIKFLFGHDDPNNTEQTDWTLSSDHKVFYKKKFLFYILVLKTTNIITDILINFHQ